jgi:hypothetical protein
VIKRGKRLRPVSAKRAAGAEKPRWNHIRQLRRDEPDPEGEPRRYQRGPSVLLRWKIGPYEYVERYDRDGQRPIAKRIDGDEAERLYRSGLSLLEIAAQIDADTGHLSRVLRQRRVPMRTMTDYATTFDEREAARLYQAGHSLLAVTRKVGGENVKVVRRAIVAQGVTIRPPGRPAGSENGTTYEYEFEQASKRVRRRSGGKCEARTQLCTEAGEQVHHRKMRSQGGTNDERNLLHVCLHCHMWIHDHPAEAYERRWLVHSWDTPEEMAR